MSSLGELFFSLGLDSKEFDKAIDEAKKKVAELDDGSKIKLQLDVEHLKSQIQEATKSISANGVSINTKVNTERIENLRRLLEKSKQQAKELEAAIADASTPSSIKAVKQRELQDVTRRIAEQEARLQSKAGTSVTAPPVPVRTVLDAESVNIVRAQLAKFGEPITAKVSVEYDVEKLQATQAVLKSLEKRIGVSADAPASNSETSSSIAELSRRIEALGKATEKISKQAVGRRSIASIEEEEMRRYNSQLQRLEEGVRKWQNVKAKIESSKIDKSSDNYKNAIRLIDAYIDKLIEAQKQAGKFTNRELTGMLGQTASGEIAKTGRLISQQKSDEQAVRNALVKEQAQIQRLEEGVRRVQNVIAKLNATDVDKGGAGYKQAIALLNDYIDKLNTAKKNAGNFTKREMAGMLGQTLGGEIAEAERLVAAQRKMEQAKEKTAKSVAQAEKEELQLKKAKIQLQKEEANLGKAMANQKKAELQKEKEAVKLRKEQVSLQNKLGKSVGNMANWAKQLNQQIGNYISIYSVERFVRNLYTIGGEFQKQQIALQNMIGDVDRGNAIFERMKDLAVKSPFTFSDLASYTKQMSAYGIEYENLYDTTKRLADISAGVGVDMGRLILAFGQVRSAAVLRGQELRQFTEAGIPLVAELAKKFTELEGRVVSTGEVFDKISKREVSFGMVKDILFDMTDPGGRFFETQEKLAESLAGKWSNLKDAWDIMIADIANGNNSVLSGLADIINSLIRGFETWLPFVSGAVVALGLLRGAITAVNIVSTANPWVLIGSVMAGVVSTIISLASETETATELITRLNRELEGAVAQNNDNERNANRYLDILKKQADSESDKYALYQKQKAAFEELLKLYPKATEIAELELMTLEEIEKTRKRIAEQTKKDNLNQYDVKIDEAYDAYEKKRIETEKVLRDSGKTIEDFPETKKELEALYNLYTNAMNAKEMYEQSFIDAARPKPLADWQIKADEIIAKYPNIAALKRDKGDDIWAYFDFLEATFKEAKEKYDRVTSESMKKPYKAIMDAVNAVNMGIGGVSLYDSKKKKGGKTPAEEAAERDAKAYLDTLKAKLSELGSQWDLYKDLFEATGDKRLSMNIAFDGVMPNFDNYISHLKGLMQEEIQKRGLGISVADLLSEGKEGIAKRVNDKSQTSWNEDVAKNLNAIIDSYNNANKKLREESVRNFLDIIKNSKDFAQQIADIDRELQKDLSDLAKMSGGTDSELYNRRAEELIKRAEEEKTKVNFEEFKKSSDWVKVFDDLDRVSDATLDNMISKIEEFAKQAHLSEEVTKQLVDAMGKLRKESIERNPLQGFKDAWGRLKYLKSGIVTKSGMIRYGSGTNEDPFTFKSKKEVDDAVSEANDDLEKAALAIAGKFNAVADAANMLSGVFKGFGDNLESFGGILNGIESGAKSGAGIASTLGIAGPWGAIAGAALGLLSSAFEMHDKAIQKEIEASEARIKMIDSLADNLEKRLSSTEGGIYSISIDPATKKVFEGFIEGFNGWEKYQNSSPRSAMHRKYKEYDYLSKDTIDAMQAAISNDSYYSAQLASLKLQKDELNKQKNDLERAKDIDETKIQDKITEIEQIEHEIAVFRKTMMDAIYGIDFKDWASQFTDSIVDAWAKGEDAADAYQRTVSNVMRNVAASVIQQSLIGKWLEDNMENVLALFEKNGGVITDDVFNAMVELASGIGGKVEEVEQFMDYWEKALNKYNLSMKDLESTEKASGGLSKGIQSVTEDTANLLASYLNATRQDVSVQRNLIEQLVSVDIPQMSIIAQAQLQQLQQVAANTKRNADAADRIYELVNKVVDKGGNKLRI